MFELKEGYAYIVLGFKVVVEGSLCNTGIGDNLVNPGRVVPVFVEQMGGCFYYSLSYFRVFHTSNIVIKHKKTDKSVYFFV